MLVDNDEGANALLSYWKITKPLSKPYFHLFGNLYLLPIPLLAGAAKTKIEDLFDPSLWGTLINGKSFDPDKPHGDHTHSGKVVFAHRVVRPNADTIDFSKFKPLLLIVSAVIEEHRKNHPKP